MWRSGPHIEICIKKLKIRVELQNMVPNSVGLGEPELVFETVEKETGQSQMKAPQGWSVLWVTYIRREFKMSLSTHPLELASFGHFHNKNAQIGDEVGVTCLISHPWLEFGTLRLPVGVRGQEITWLGKQPSGGRVLESLGK